MGTLYSYHCPQCDFKAALSTKQPYHLFSGSVLQKYCPATEQIVKLFKDHMTAETRISCQDPKWQEKLDDPSPCQNCKGECLKELENIPQCPRCGSEMRICGVIFAD